MESYEPDIFDPADSEGVALEGLTFDRGTLLKGALAGALVAGLPASVASAALEQKLPKPRGRLRLGIIGATTENFDPHQQRNLLDLVRNSQVYEALVQVRGPKVTRRLAESWEPNNRGDQWQVKLKSGLEFHNGKTVTADDVLYSYRRVKAKGRGRLGLAAVDLDRSKKVNARTIIFQLTAPYSLFATGPLGGATIVPDGQDVFAPATVVGTGPFRLGQVSVGQRALFRRFPNYWQKGVPFLRELELLSFGDATAKLNALLAGQIDAIDSIQPSQVSRARRAGFKILTAPGGVWNPIVMDVTQEPFTDNRVRTAMKLMADRPLLVKNALGGYGSLGNDIFSNPGFDTFDFPAQRQQNIAQARSLLRAAGKDDLSVTLHTGEVATGLVASALIFAQDAREAGVTVEVKQYPADTYYSGPYLKEAFYQSNWSTKTLDAQSLQCIEGGFLETKWKNPRFVELMQAARKTFVEKKREDFYDEASRILRNDGGYIIWGFQDSLDAASKKFKGFGSAPGRAFGGYNFKTVRPA
jgi:peptide/nickel transport system substrate-binding protein